jgi:hypothetical protein
MDGIHEVRWSRRIGCDRLDGRFCLDLRVCGVAFGRNESTPWLLLYAVNMRLHACCVRACSLVCVGGTVYGVGMYMAILTRLAKSCRNLLEARALRRENTRRYVLSIYHLSSIGLSIYSFYSFHSS